MVRRLALALAAAAAVTLIARAQQPSSALANLKTTAEASGFTSTSTYDDVVKFMKTVAGASPLVHYVTYGTTYENRPMPMVIVGTGLTDASAASVKATGKLRVHIQGNIHAGEVEGKESAQILIRELAIGQHAEWLRSMVLLITPIFNADGNERFGLNTRGMQNGPINGQGTRANAQNININRDFMKLESPEGAAFVKLWNDYDPQVGFDLHTSDGAATGYYLTYAPGLNPDTSDTLLKVQKDEWFPSVTTAIKARTNSAPAGQPSNGWDTFYYGTIGRGGGAGGRGRAAVPTTPEVVGAPPTPPTPRVWSTFEHVPRFHNNYVGLRNRFALLSEAYAYATFEDRIKVTNYFVEESLNFANANADRLKNACADADKEIVIGKTLGTRAQKKRSGMIDLVTGELEPEVNPVSGANMNRRKNVTGHEQVINELWFEPTRTETAPAEYYVPAELTKSLDLLRQHGLQMRQLTQPVKGVEQFTITANTARPAANNSDTGAHPLRTLDGAWVAAPDVTVPTGAWVIPMNQPLARLAFYLLEPTSDDGLTNWNFLDDVLKDAKAYPILRKR